MNLRQVGEANFTDKAAHGYFEIYEKLWSDLKEKPISILEIGIYNGNSLRTWCEWFPNALVVGVDSNPFNWMRTDRAKLRFGKQDDELFITGVAKEFEGFDIIIDDAGHVWEEQQLCFKYLWPHLKSGGMYIIEDLHTSADIFWAKGKSELNTVDFLKEFLTPIILDETQDMESIHCYSKLAVIYKRR